MACLAKKDSLRRQYKIKGNIGRGGFGCVSLARHRFTGTLVAIKTLENLEEHLQMVKAEMATLQLLQHLNIIQLFQIIVTEKHTYIITEYASGGNLAELVRRGGRLQEEKAQKLFGQLVSAIRYCHDRDIIHRDLKPQNILLDAEGNVKVADFGLARRCQAGTMLQGRCGTNVFNAPELIMREGYDGKKTDVWSLGVVLYFITTGRHPFKGSSRKETKGNIMQGTYEVPAHVSGQLENLILQMLTVAPEKRPSIEDIEQHPWVMKCEALLPDDTDADPHILDLLFDLGFDANTILESLQKRNYDEMMGTYLIIKEQREVPTCSHALLSRTSAAPCIPGSILEEEMPLPPVWDPDTEAASSPQNTRCIERLLRRIRAGLSRWCCCFPWRSKTQTQPMSTNRVAPVTEEGRSQNPVRNRTSSSWCTKQHGRIWSLSAGQEGTISMSNTLIATTTISSMEVNGCGLCLCWPATAQSDMAHSFLCLDLEFL